MTQFEEKDFSEKLDFGIWKRLLAHGRGLKPVFVALGISMGLLACLETLGPLLTKYSIDHFVAQGTVAGLPWFALLYFGITVVQAISTYFFLYNAGRVEAGMCYSIRREGFERLQQLPFSYYDRTPVGWIMARMTSDSQRLAEVIAWGLVDVFWGAASLLTASVAMFILNWRLALVTMAVVPALAYASLFFQRRMLESQREIRKTNSRITGAFNEGIMGARTTKTLLREHKNSEEFQELTDTMYKSSVRAAVFSSLYIPLVSVLASCGSALVLVVGGDGVISGVLLMGTLYAFISYASRFFDPIRHLSRIFAELQAAQAAAERVMGLLGEKPEIVDAPGVREAFSAQYGADPSGWPGMDGRIEFRDVTFAYGEGEKVLEHFDLVVPSGQSVALVGETGAGKSTIVNLACRFYEPTSGSILIDGRDYREYPMHWLYSRLGYVLQSPHLFSGTVEENIRYAKPTATREEVEAAAKLVSAHEFILRLEKGYDTEVGEGGDRLSTGEKQLVSFARAVLSDPCLFVLDEATSSVDTETEQAIQHAILQLLSGRTSFVVAHRLSTIRNADRILVISDGRIIEDGTHRELMSRRGHYHALYVSQFIDESVGV